jgi:hypothetical protein
MAKTTTPIRTKIPLSDFRTQRQQLLGRLGTVYKEAREIEDALGLSSRILPEPPSDSVPFEEPRGKKMRAVWEHLITHPGLGSVALRKALRMKDVPMATALNTLKKNGQIQVRGRRGAYKYFAVVSPR